MEKWTEPEVYAVKHKNDNVRTASRSGGVFTALSDEVFDRNGVVYGCILTNDFHAIHIRADNSQMRDQMRGSKYVQSSMGDTFFQVKKDLDFGTQVLFSGTSCQIAGLYSFLGREYENLLCVDIVCHGVPSLLVWEQYVKWREKKYSGKTVSVDFRNKKKYGWRDHVETLTMDNGRVSNSRVFARMFYGHNIIRPCCYRCPYKSVIHPGNITIADYWGIENAAPEFDDNKGVSLILINDVKGKDAFEQARKHLIWKATRLQDSMQPPLIRPFEKPADRSQFWADFQKMDFEHIARKYGGAGAVNKFKDALSIIKHKIWR